MDELKILKILIAHIIYLENIEYIEKFYIKTEFRTTSDFNCCLRGLVFI